VVSDDEQVARALHELRGPLGAVRLGVELGLRAGSLCGPRLRSLELELGRAALALEDLERALGCGADRVRRRGGGDATTTEPAPVELRRLLVESVEAWRPVAGPRGLVLERSAPFAGELWVRGDRLRLAQGVGNLLANAIEHGSGTIRVRLRRAGSEARVEVGDEGPGLAAPLRDLIRRPGHYGLRVVDEVALAHRGRLLSAPSERGSRLVLELPLAAAGSAGRLLSG